MFKPRVLPPETKVVDVPSVESLVMVTGNWIVNLRYLPGQPVVKGQYEEVSFPM